MDEQSNDIQETRRRGPDGRNRQLQRLTGPDDGINKSGEGAKVKQTGERRTKSAASDA